MNRRWPSSRQSGSAPISARWRLTGISSRWTPTDIKEMTRALGSIGRNINQIAKRVNAGGPAYQADMEEIRERLEQIWQLQRRILLSQR